jgi:repressor LexA
MTALTTRQLEILEFIEEYIRNKGCSPSYREIVAKFHFASTASVHKHIQSLLRKGALTSCKKQPRSLQVTHAPLERLAQHTLSLPLKALLRDSVTWEHVAKGTCVAVPPLLVPNPAATYLIKVEGDNFQLEEQIAPGDLLILEERTTAFNGETVLLMVNKREILIKRYHQDDSLVRLESANPNFTPLLLRPEAIVIKGILVGLLRTY